jgi:hypothetical protein
VSLLGRKKNELPDDLWLATAKTAIGMTYAKIKEDDEAVLALWHHSDTDRVYLISALVFVAAAAVADASQLRNETESEYLDRMIIALTRMRARER